MAVDAVLTAALTVTEKLGDAEAPFAIDGQRQITHTGLNLTKTLGSATSPAISAGHPFTVTLAAGAATLDLTAISNPRGGTTNANALKLRAILLKARDANTQAIVVSKGGTNGYTIGGSTFTLPVEPGCYALLYLADKAPAVGGTAKNIGFAGTGTEAIDCIALFG